MNTQSVQNYLTGMQYATAQIEAEESKARMGSESMDKHAFLKLMTEQLRYQDPLKPMDNSQFLSQQAQFTQIEELQNLSSALTSSNSLSQASSFIGKEVTVIDPDDDTRTITGTVSAAHTNSTGAAIEMGGIAYPLDLIQTVKSGS